MFEWFKKKSRQKAFKNIIEILDSLIEVSDRAYKDISRLGDSTPSDSQEICRLQEDLVIQFMGPLPFDRLKAHLIDPILSCPETSEGTRRAIEHVCNEIAKRIEDKKLSWNKDDYAAYDAMNLKGGHEGFKD